MQQLKTVRHFRSMTPILRNEKKNWCIYNIWQQASPRTDLFILREIPPNFCCLQIPKVPIFPWHLIQRKIPFVVHKLFFFQTSRASFISFSPEFLKIGGFPLKKTGSARASQNSRNAFCHGPLLGREAPKYMDIHRRPFSWAFSRVIEPQRVSCHELNITKSMISHIRFRAHYMASRDKSRKSRLASLGNIFPSTRNPEGCCFSKLLSDQSSHQTGCMYQ